MNARRDPMKGILAGPIDGPASVATVFPEVEAPTGLAVTHRASGFRGTVVRLEAGGVELRGQTGLERVFRSNPGAFSVDGRAVTLIRPRGGGDASSGTTASGSVAVPRQPARVARAGRILVEGVHDAALVERVWGDDLRIEGIVVERLDGIDNLPGVVRDFKPGPARRLGVLVDHLVAGSKEARLAATMTDANVLVTGTPYVDVWEAVKPAVVGIEGWPRVPLGTDWKTGVCEALGVPDSITMWRRILAAVDSYVDLEPPLVGAVEALIDFVTDTR
ncbi:MAG TPA: DUF3097 family protein [Acidimicrobiales bacterium]|jgi:hypothetical protein|nr:DUF3097 family protein [Acidimicrobiales bacterium]